MFKLGPGGDGSSKTWSYAMSHKVLVQLVP
jgi:hypothetical protein